MAKKKQTSDEVAPQFYATKAYKQWARAKLKKSGWSLDELARQIRRVNPAANATSGGLSQFFGTLKDPAGPSNTTLMPELNKLFGIAPPPVCDPSSTFAQIRDAFEAKWVSLTAKEQKTVLAVFGIDLVDLGS